MQFCDTYHGGITFSLTLFTASKFKPCYTLIPQSIGNMHISWGTWFALGSVCPCRSMWFTPGWTAQTWNYWRNSSKSENTWKRSRKQWGETDFFNKQSPKSSPSRSAVQKGEMMSPVLSQQEPASQELGSHAPDPWFLVPREDSAGPFGKILASLC